MFPVISLPRTTRMELLVLITGYRGGFQVQLRPSRVACDQRLQSEGIGSISPLCLPSAGVQSALLGNGGGSIWCERRPLSVTLSKRRATRSITLFITLLCSFYPLFFSPCPSAKFSIPIFFFPVSDPAFFP